jgi:putative tryptophan/tyrosine transport system substrate-binding protein
MQVSRCGNSLTVRRHETGRSLDMRRRHVIALLAALPAWPLAAWAQQSADMPAIGMLFPGSADAAAVRAKLVWEGLKESGFVEGKNLALLTRATDFNPEKTSQFAAELDRAGVRVILAVGPPAVRAAHSVTTTTPIVALDLETDPVSTGLIASFARPGGNVTGLFFDFPEFSAKWLELLQEAVPGLSRVAVVWDPTTGPVQVKAAEAAAASRGLHLQIIEVREPSGLEDALAAANLGNAQGLVVLSSPLFSAVIGAKPVAEMAARHRLPAISLFPEFAQFGGLMGYGPSLPDLFHQAGALVGKVLHGQKPAELPVERPSRFNLVVNLKTAKALGLEIPSQLIARADEVIE